MQEGRVDEALEVQVTPMGASVGQLSFTWELPGSEVATEVPRVTFTPSEPGTFTVRAVATDEIGRAASCDITLTVEPSLRLACPAPIETPPFTTVDVRVELEGELASESWRALRWPDTEDPPQIDESGVGAAQVTVGGLGTYTFSYAATALNGEELLCEVVIRTIGDAPSPACPAAIEGDAGETFELRLRDVAGTIEDVDWTVADRPRTSRLAQPALEDERGWVFTPDAVGRYRLVVSLRLDGAEQQCEVPLAVRNRAALRVEMAWNTEGNADLRLGNPMVRTVGRDTADVCHSRNCDESRGHVLDWGGRFDREDNPRLLQDASAFGPETIVLSRVPYNGTFLVGVSSRFNAQAEIAVYCGGAELEATRVLEHQLRTNEIRVAAEVDIDGDECTVRIPD
ncbi:MAG: PKD domain-containing protein [Myxococcota bacterium]